MDHGTGAWYTERMLPTTPQLIVALDYPDAPAALAMARRLVPLRPWVKVGLELLMAAGPSLATELRTFGLPVFLDGKFHDIPNTVAGAVKAAVSTGASMLNVHASGGVRMMRAAADAAALAATAHEMPRPLLIAVTVLTSLSAEELRDEVGCARAPEDQVVMLALRAQEAGLDGVVASPLEATAIRQACGPDFAIVTPGVRPSGGAADDQRRTATPSTAIAAGANYLVVGRPITQAPDPLEACARILAEMQQPD